MSFREILLGLEDKVHPKHCAVLVIDVQNDFCADGGWYSKTNDMRMIQAMVPKLNDFLETARATGVLTLLIKTIYSQHVISPVMREKLIRRGLDLSYCIDGTWGAQFYGIRRHDKDIVVIKERHSAFFGTELDTILRQYDIRTVILTGVATNVCVDCTARDAFARDYFIVFLSDCTATFSAELHDYTLKNIDRVFGTVSDSNQVRDTWSRLNNRKTV